MDEQIELRDQKQHRKNDIVIDQSLIDEEVPDLNIPLKAIYHSSNLFDNLIEKALLNTINGLLEHKFHSISDAIQVQNLRIFFHFLFYSNHKIYQKLLSKNTIEGFIKVFSTDDPIFSIKLFNFQDPKYTLSSSITFFKLVLNQYFIKQSRGELFERCSTIIFSLTSPGDFFYDKYTQLMKRKKNPFDDRSILFQWETYVALAYFVYKRKTHFKSHIKERSQYYFAKKNIPQIIDEKYLESYNFHEQDAIFYQLQYIFNALDKQDFSFKFCECSLVAIRKLKLMKVPNYKTLAANIKAKNISLIVQMKKLEGISSDKQQTCFCDYNDLNVLSKKCPSKPINFDQRQMEKSKKIEKTKMHRRKNHPSLDLKTPETFWNPTNSDYAVDNGVLFNKKCKNKLNQQLIDNISNYESEVKKNIFHNESSLFYKIPRSNIKSQLYKFFYYNEQSQKWIMDTTLISNFICQKYLNTYNQRLSLVFFSNSYENDLITLNSQLLLTLYPDLDDNGIYIYALCERPISLLEFNTNIQEETANIKPIFLLLHVPESKRNLDNIRTIIFKIYFFLSIVCDIEIIILNKEHYYDQIGLLKGIQNVKLSYKETSQIKIERRNSNMKRNSAPQLDSPKIKFNRNSISVSSNDLSDDGDSNSDDESLAVIEKEAGNRESFLDFNISNMNSMLDLIDLHPFVKKSKHIILIHDETINGDINKVNDNELFSSIREQIKDEMCSINYINVNNVATYRLFLNSLKEFSQNVTTNSEDIMKCFEIFPITEINSRYIELKGKDEWGNDLINIINDRFQQYKKADCGESSDFILISKLNAEITQMNPLIGHVFHNKCNSILGKIRKDLTQTNDDVFTSELSISSENNLEYLKQVINNKIYLPPEKKDFIFKNHENFLNNEFFSIIRALYPTKEYAYIMNRNISILKNQIEKDKQEIAKIFLDLESKYQPPKDRGVDLIDEIHKGTNYSIRETERVREIKVVAEAGHLKDIIPQDF